MFESSLEGFKSTEIGTQAASTALEQELKSQMGKSSAIDKSVSIAKSDSLYAGSLFNEQGNVIGRPRFPDVSPLRRQLSHTSFQKLEKTLDDIDRLSPIQIKAIDNLANQLRGDLTDSEKECVNNTLDPYVCRNAEGRITVADHGWGKGATRVAYDKKGNIQDVDLADGQNWHRNADGSWKITVPGKGKNGTPLTYTAKNMTVEMDQKTGNLNWINFPGTDHEEHRQVSLAGIYNPDTTKDQAKTQSNESTEPTVPEKTGILPQEPIDTKVDKTEIKTLASNLEDGKLTEYQQNIERLSKHMTQEEIGQLHQLVVQQLRNDFLFYMQDKGFDKGPCAELTRNLQKAVTAGYLTQSEVDHIMQPSTEENN